MSSHKEGQFQTSDIPDLHGYVTIVTGGNSGIGYETSLQLARRHARVYIAGRSEARINEAISKMRNSNERAADYDLHVLSMDLSSLSSVQAAAEDFKKREKRLDLLVNNAGADWMYSIMATPYALTEDGLERQFQTNHLAHHLLFTSLLPMLQATAAGNQAKDRVRVVNVSSDAYSIGPQDLNLEDPNLASLSGPTAPLYLSLAMSAYQGPLLLPPTDLPYRKRYGHSKLASLVHARAIHNHYSSLGISSFALQPGVIPTNLLAADKSFLGSIIRFGVRFRLIPGTISIEDGARTTLFCATSPEARRWSGRYIRPYGKVDKRADKWIENGKIVEGLWEGSERLLREKGF